MSNPTEQHNTGQPELSRISWGLGLCLFLGIALFFLWQEHKAHILGALPYAVLLLCPLIHLFTHRSRGAHDHSQGKGESLNPRNGGRS